MNQSNQAIVLNQGKPLDFVEVRQQVARIPEVVSRLREAQSIWDKCQSCGDVNFFETLISDDDKYFSSRAIRSLLTSVVQLGLYDRLSKRSGQAPLIIGNVRNESVVKVIAGVMSLEELICNSRVNTNKKSKLELLQGQEFALFEAYELVEEAYQPAGEASENLQSLLSWVAENRSIKQFVTVGPGSIDFSKNAGMLSEVSFIESIDSDPMLSWFWQGVKKASA